MAFIVKNDLSKFSEKLKNYRKQGDLAQKVADKVAEKGAEIAQKNWESGVIISIKGDKTQKSIVAILKNQHLLIGNLVLVFRVKVNMKVNFQNKISLLLIAKVRFGQLKVGNMLIEINNNLKNIQSHLKDKHLKCLCLTLQRNCENILESI